MQERFLNSSLGLCLWFELFYTFLAYLEGPQNKKLEIYRRQKPKMLCNKIQGCRGQNHAGEVSKFKFRYLSLICAVLHLSSISGSSSTQKNSKFIEGRSKKSGATKDRVVEVRIMQERFLNSSLGLFLWFELFYTFLAYLEGPQNKKTRNLQKAEAKNAVQQNTGL